ncbi:response regulator [Beijerinckia indica]|uniref:Response regulator receiver protein n=1 Tax=Beijerinckia indica subsp. indica (strain ATCC 9039 / DSM 1715 / NCIMB 8712) TaxID=395963 RepID=B2IGA6_BEII9|nr:response regulator [Beijerinckia indica]ACB97180.1 response regulator receiver protein [Beijerinckia indica subsp. indica ATCC 9039]
MPFAAAVRVLIVDDQLTSRLLIRGGLEDLGMADIEMASNGEEALKNLSSKPAHLIISDFNMPKLDGIGLLRAVRAHEQTRKIPFIMLTGKGDRALMERAAQAGVNNFLAKPFTVPVLKTQIEAVIGKLK